MATFITTGGIGKTLCFSAAIPKLAAKYGDINIMSPWADLFYNLPGVRRSVDLMLEYGYEDYFKGQDRFSPEPYNNNRFFKKEIGLIEAFFEELDLPFDRETDVPLVPFTSQMAINKIQEIKKNGEFIVVQFMGGNQAQNGKPSDKIMVKDYPVQYVEQVLLKIREKYPKMQIVNYGLPFEWNIEGTISVGDLPYTAAPYLLNEAKTFIAMDSNLQHFSICKNIKKTGIVLWGATSPVSFGYEHNYNLTNECPLKDQFCNRPYFQHTSDIVGKGNVWSCPARSCININPDNIMEYLDKIMNPVEEPKAESKKQTKGKEAVS